MASIDTPQTMIISFTMCHQHMLHPRIRFVCWMCGSTLYVPFTCCRAHVWNELQALCSVGLVAPCKLAPGIAYNTSVCFFNLQFPTHESVIFAALIIWSVENKLTNTCIPFWCWSLVQWLFLFPLLLYPGVCRCSSM